LRVKERRQAILALLASNEHVSTTLLSERLGVTSVTVRSDLDVLEQRGRLRRVHGGAVSASPLVETSHDYRGSLDSAEKRLIALAAVSLLEPASNIILDVGTTTLAIAEEIVADTSIEGLTIITNGLPIAAALEAAVPRVSVYLTGGALRPLQHSLVNPGVTESLERVHASIAFIGADAIHPVNGMTTTNFPEADVKEAMRRATERSVLVAAASKIGEVAMVNVNEVRAFDTLITAGDVSAAQIGELEASGLEVFVAAPGATDARLAARPFVASATRTP